MIGDWIFIFVIDLIAIAMIVLGSIVTNSLDDASGGIISKEESFRKAYDDMKTAAAVSLYTGIAILVIVTACIAGIFINIPGNLVLKSVVKLLFGAGIVATATVVAVYYSNVQTNIRETAFYTKSRLAMRKALDNSLYYINLLVQTYITIAIVTALLFVAIIVYDVYKKRYSEEKFIQLEFIEEEEEDDE